MVKFHTKKVEDLLKLGIAIMILCLLNILGQKFYDRIDLTEENRFSVSPATKSLLSNLQEDVYIEIYLDGDIPSGFKRLQNSILENLKIFNEYAGNKIKYKFIDPSSINQSAKARNAYYQSIANKGIQPTNVFSNDNGNKVEKLIFPGALISYNGEETSVNFLKGNKSTSPEEQLNQSVENVEYELAKAILNISQKERNKIVYLTGNGEAIGKEATGLIDIIKENYELEITNLKNKEIPSDAKAIVLAKPSEKFSDEEIYKIDQYIAHGGNALMLIDPIKINIDSVRNGQAIVFPYDLGLDNLLIKFGIRLNNNLVQDLNSGVYPIVTGMRGNVPQIQMLPWPFYPIANKYAKHPITRNLDAVFSQFASSIDTLKTKGSSRIPLISSSQTSKTIIAPLDISLNTLRKNATPQSFNEGSQALAYLVEGKINSLYKNRFLPEFADKTTFKAESEKSKIIITADANIGLNQINGKTGEPYELGYDPFLKNTFANADFIQNSLAYLTESNGVISSRNKEVKIRPLDKTKIHSEKAFWQTLNLVLPLILLGIFGTAKYLIRKQKYSK
ncbi:gliding motility-associated ABC transporter substrate-binding protein GldG [Aureibacter tunicatorum]|uniref:Gliding-associated putative ABC transporter substrate-binding component GldG n=1 Tax=Aureibacter tunicatorum TaxID=866807 RepID=A0AAE3XQG4_9BACT|nr:gliding motility-associated ABC transporter substrate-binding protein GldG [Aureibacter tunicatorum]MDR6241247.1 gliding-associated putative ABC transporter substrate-binding component GldG [Aureibacter tunicatorum]BDD03507.1 gliding motility-associated ABC transporter substrate-binding protein GldG [Aureibacter tunicatorum]